MIFSYFEHLNEDQGESMETLESLRESTKTNLFSLGKVKILVTFPCKSRHFNDLFMLSRGSLWNVR